MSSENETGNFQAEIGQDVIEAALKSVEGPAPVPPAAAAPEPAPPAPQDELGELRAELEFSQAKGRELLEKLKVEHERALRAAADLDNFKKRAAREKDEVLKFGTERLLKDLLPVMDNLERALEAAQGQADAAGLAQGVAMTRKLFEDVLGRHGVKGFSAVGQPFDPRLHEAMSQTETAEVPAGHVALQMLRGYTLNERLVRPALVSVARAPVAEPTPPGSADASGAGDRPRGE